MILYMIDIYIYNTYVYVVYVYMCHIYTYIYINMRIYTYILHICTSSDSKQMSITFLSLYITWNNNNKILLKKFYKINLPPKVFQFFLGTQEPQDKPGV